MDCPFCEIDKERTRVLKEGKWCSVILSNPRLMPGHLLVIPNRHVEKISDLSAEEQGEIWDLLVEFEERILAKLAKGCDIRQHYRPFMKQDWTKVDHLHFHLLPREFEDELFQKSMKYEREMFAELPDEERERMVEVLGS